MYTVHVCYGLNILWTLFPRLHTGCEWVWSRTFLSGPSNLHTPRYLQPLPSPLSSCTVRSSVRNPITMATVTIVTDNIHATVAVIMISHVVFIHVRYKPSKYDASKRYKQYCISHQIWWATMYIVFSSPSTRQFCWKKYYNQVIFVQQSCPKDQRKSLPPFQGQSQIFEGTIFLYFYDFFLFFSWNSELCVCMVYVSSN